MLQAQDLSRPSSLVETKGDYHWPESEFYVSERHRLVYCPIQKVACSSLKLWWAEIMEGTAGTFVSETMYGQKIDHGGLNQRFKLHRQAERLGLRPLHEDGWFRIVFVRNPWSRLVSVFANKFVPLHAMVEPVFQETHNRWSKQPVRRAGELMLQTLAPFVASARGQLRSSIWPMLRGTKAWHDEFTFRHFIDFLSCHLSDGMETDLHWRPQYQFLGDVKFDYIGRFERLHEDMRTISGLLGVDAQVPVTNVTNYAGREPHSTKCFADTPISELRSLPAMPDYRQFYSRGLKQQVASLYQRDVEQFGYDFES